MKDHGATGEEPVDEDVKVASAGPERKPTLNEQALADLRRFAPRAVRIGLLLVLVVLVLVAAAIVIGRSRTPSPPSAGQPPGTAQPPAGTDSAPAASTVRSFLQKLRDNNETYKAHLNSTGMVFTPYDAGSVGWDARRKDGSASVTFDQLTAADTASLIRSLTVNNTVVPSTLKVTTVNENPPDSSNWGFEFTIETTTGKTLTGRALGRGKNGGLIQRLTYNVNS